MAEDKPADKDRYSRKYRVEEIERTNCADADEVKERALHAKISKRLMEALKDPIPARYLIGFCHKPRRFELVLVLRLVTQYRLRRAYLYAPQPAQYVHRKYRDTRTGRNSGERLLGSWFPVGETVATDDDRNKAGDLCDGAGEESLNGGKPGVEGRAALGISSQGENEKS
jgi:hypothetical protein